MQVFVTGGTGLIGARLVRRLMERRDRPVVLTRREATAEKLFGKSCRIVEGDPMKAGPWQDVASECDAAVNLAGENLFNHRWNDQFKTLMTDSRLQTTAHVVEALGRKPRREDGTPKVLVNASAIGYYGPHGDEELTEESAPASDFLANLCVQWEKAARTVETFGVRCALTRIGVVLDKQGGVLAKLRTPFYLGMGGPVGDGRQWMSWIHHEDMTGVLLLALDNNEAVGPLNGTAPNPVTNRDFSTALGKALHRPSFMPTPGFVLRAMLGESADVITTGQRVLPKKTIALGYQYKFPTIDAALADIVGK
jgi:uncharacterized protein (TIGR01777 family)